MTDRIKAAFNYIHAEESLKKNTVAYIQGEIRRRRENYRRSLRKKFAVIAATLIIIVSGAFSHNLYFTASAYVDMDINPSIGITVNRFDRVIGVCAYNSDGEVLLSELSLKHRNYIEAIEAMFDILEQNGFLKDGELVSVTLQAVEPNTESEFLNNIRSKIEPSVVGRQDSAQIEIDIFSVSSDIRDYAHELNITPAKYLAIMELIEVAPDESVESCRNHSINEIRQLTQNHAENHHGKKHGQSHK